MDSADPLALRVSSGDAQVDDILRGIVRAYEAVFPGRVRGYYLLGSYADGDAVEISDIDLMLLFRGTLDDAERARGKELERDVGSRDPVRLDLWLAGEDGQAREAARRQPDGALPLYIETVRGAVALKLGGVCVYGEDVRERVALPPLAVYTRDAMDGGAFFLRWVLRRAEQLRFPLEYPDLGGAFYGYDTVRVTEWYPPDTAHGIKELVTSTTRCATALVALAAGRYVGTKGGAITGYREHIGGERADYLEELYTSGKHRWRYRVPDAPAERERLRALCARTLDFERHFFAVFREYLLAAARSADEDARRFAAEQLATVLYTDGEMLDTLDTLRQDGAARVRVAAEAALAARSTA